MNDSQHCAFPNKTSSNSSLYHERVYPGLLVKRDSASSLVEDDTTDPEDFATNKVIIQEQSSFVFEGVRFTPKVVEFSDAFEGKQFVQEIKLQNVGKRPVYVRIGEPNSFVFHMNKHDRNMKLLSSGRSITRVLTYVYHNDDIVQRSQIKVQINGQQIDYPIVVRKAQPIIEVKPNELDFKVLNMGASAKTLKITISNTGGKGTKFAIDLGRNELDLVVNPTRGTIRAKSQINVYVEMVGITEGEFYKEMWITTNEKPIRVPVIAEVMRPRLEVYHPNATGDFTLINFPPTFYGTQHLDSIVLRNFSADITPFVIFAEVGGELKISSDARKLHTGFQMFMMSSEEGRLEPFESRIITIIFKPMKKSVTEGWHHKIAEERKKIPNQEFLVFFRINRVHCIEKYELEKETDQKHENQILAQKELEKRQSIMVTVASAMAISGIGMNTTEPIGIKFSDGEERHLSDTFMPLPIEDKDVVRLCLHGEACEPELLVQPNSLYFEKIPVKKTEAKVLKLTNVNTIPIKFVIHKIVNMKMNPDRGWLDPKCSKEISVLYTPSFPGEFKTSIKIEIFGKSAVLFDEDQSIISLRTVKVHVTIVVEATKKALKPEITLGITPQMTNEVGMLSELITFGSSYPKPYTAMLGALRGDTKRKWMINESDKEKNVKNALIAFPNDRPRNNNWPAGRVARTIFTGTFRYSPPINQQYTLTDEEIMKRTDNRQMWRKYLRRLSNFVDPGDHSDNTDLSPDRVMCLMEGCDKRTLLKLDSVLDQERLDQFRCFRQKETIYPKFALIPLSPLFLCNIKVEPKLIDFAMVAPNSSVSEILKLHNMNPFPVGVRFIPGKSGVTLPEGDTRFVPPLGKKLLRILFKTKDFGRYNGFLDYVINGSHQFKITVSANVVPKTLVIPDNYNNIEIGNFPKYSAFQPCSKSIKLVNNLRSPIKYHWEMQGDSSFEIEPINGEVPPMMSIMAQVYFRLQPEKAYFSEAHLVSESGSVQQIKLSYRKSKPNVFFLTNKIEIKQIPLNLLATVNPTLKNTNYYEVAFEVVDQSPMPGIKILPCRGTIKPRCSYDLLVEFQIPVIIDFEFDVKVRIHQGSILSLTISGSVVCPLVKITPMEITMRRISAQSFDVATVCMENIGKTPAHILIDLKEYPEYKISRRKDKMYDFEDDGVLLLPQKSFRFFIHFEPADVARYRFYLPIVINGILGPPMMQNSTTEYMSFYIEKFEELYGGFGHLTRSADLKTKIPCACINCTVAGHILKFSTLNVVFHKDPVFSKQFQEEEIEVTNIHFTSVTLCIRTDDVNNKLTPFKFEAVGDNKIEYHSKSMKIHLESGQAVTFKANFMPVKSGIYSIQMPVYVRGYNEGFVYNFIHLSGELKKARLYSETKEIHFPPVPLQIGTEIIIQVCAQGYRFTDIISYNIWEEFGKYNSDTIKVLWLDEPKILGTKDFQMFSVQISFQSSLPISLRTFLIFYDSKGEYFPVMITAIADNSSITTHLFLSTRFQKYRLIREDVEEKLTEEELTYSNLKSAHLKYNENTPKKLKNGSKSPKRNEKRNGSSRSIQVLQAEPVTRIDPGPKLVIQMTKSMQRITQINFVSGKKFSDIYKKNESNFAASTSSSLVSHTDLLSGSTKSSLKTAKGIGEVANDVMYPLFPTGEENTYYDRYLLETLHYVEQWVYEVAFHCEEYLTIPRGFQLSGSEDEPYQIPDDKELRNGRKKTVIDLVAELAGSKVRHFFPDKPIPQKDSPGRAEHMYSIFYCLLDFLNIQGCFLPHVRPENLLCYKDYEAFMSKHPACETIKCGAGTIGSNAFRKISSYVLNGGVKFDRDDHSLAETSSLGTLNELWNKQDDIFDEETEFREKKAYEADRVTGASGTSVKRHGLSADNENMKEKDYAFKAEHMDEKIFTLRSTQAWLDVLLQIFRVLVLPKIVYKKIAPSLGAPDTGEVFSIETMNNISYDTPKVNTGEFTTTADNLESNIYTIQERILLSWLNYHYDLQRSLLWASSLQSEEKSPPPPRKIDSFKSDLSDSLALMAVTASYCTYLIPKYFIDIFSIPENNEQKYHNAIQLTSAWREVNIGLTVEPKDIIQSNAVFMLMIVCHLYEILPVLSPQSLVRFTAPLTGELVRIIELINTIDEKITYEAKFIGDQDGSFRLVGSSTIILKPNKKTEFKIAYRARRIHRVSVTLLLDGASVSPHFAISMVFSLEGEPSKLTEFTTIKLTGTLYKVTCMNVPIVPPYEEEANYEISYSTVSPNDSDTKLGGMKQWREIWNRKTSRRLFLNQSILAYNGTSPAILSVTIGCLTNLTRSFWLLFRSDIGDFIIRIDVISKVKDIVCGPIPVTLPDTWNNTINCICTDVEKNLIMSNTSACPLVFYLRVPARNNYLWNTMFIMFQKTLDTKEKSFWKQHFETNIGIRLIKWLLSQDESEEVIDEFIPALRTSVTYSLKLDSQSDKYICIKPTLEVPDVRSNESVYLPVHISQDVPKELKVTITMVSENKKEMRIIKFLIHKPCDGNDVQIVNLEEKK